MKSKERTKNATCIKRNKTVCKNSVLQQKEEGATQREKKGVDVDAVVEEEVRIAMETTKEPSVDASSNNDDSDSSDEVDEEEQEENPLDVSSIKKIGERTKGKNGKTSGDNIQRRNCNTGCGNNGNSRSNGSIHGQTKIRGNERSIGNPNQELQHYRRKGHRNTVAKGEKSNKTEEANKKKKPQAVR